MRRLVKKGGKITKGMPSAVLLSILIHAALFLLAGTLVVFTVVKREEKKFVPPKAVERPKMKLKKPKVKVKNTSKPKPTTRIVTKVNRASMPEIQLPEMSGMGGGLTGGIGGFDVMPDLDEVTVFGGGQSIGNDFVGTFYDLKRDRNGRNIPMNRSQFVDKIADFVASDWKLSKLSRFYQSPKKLYASTFAMGSMQSVLAPAAFESPDTGGYCWMVHYKGQLVHRDGITFRFRGLGDDLLLVRVDGRIVLNGCLEVFAPTINYRWQSQSADSRKYFGFEVGDWITLEPGIPLDMEVIVGEVPGGAFSSMLVVDVQGEEHEENFRGWPVFPIFKTALPSLDLHEAIYAYLAEGIADITNGPVFCDYNTSGRAAAIEEPEPVEPPVLAEPAENEMREWNGVDGKTLKAKFVTVIGKKAVLVDVRGRQRKVLLDRLSDEDRLYIEFAQPPKLSIDFSKQSNQRVINEGPYTPGWPMPRVFDYVFSARLKQTSTGEYNHELKAEYFAIGEELDGDNYILLDHQESRFTPTKENDRSHTFSGETVEVLSYMLWVQSTNRRGEKYGGYLVIITDERGEIIDHASPYKWIFPKLESLRNIPVGRHFNKSCIRVFPPRPKREY